MQKITLVIDDILLKMLNEIKEHREKETKKEFPFDELINSFIIAHYMVEVKEKKLKIEFID
ncbi:hypothetical protein ACWM35_13695 [Neobacillus sp. K501]